MADEIDDLIKDFEKYDFNFTMKDITLNIFLHQRLFADFLALRKLIVKHISETTLRDKDELLEEFEGYTAEIFRDIWADFVSRHGSPSNED